MAKDKKAKAKKEEKTETQEFEFGVEDIAEELGIKPASVRVQLRNKGIEKAGKSYGWDTKKELNAVIDQLRSGKDEDEDEKPAKKSKKDKPAKASKSKKGKKARDEEDE